MDCFDYDNVKINKDSENIILEKQSKPGNFIPLPYLSHLLETKKAIDFISNSDFKTFNSNIPNLKELLVLFYFVWVAIHKVIVHTFIQQHNFRYSLSKSLL